MRGGRARAGLAVLLAIVALGAVLVPVLGIPGGAPDQNHTLCGNTEGCHGIVGSNTSRANVTMFTDRLTVHTNQSDILVLVNVTGAEQKMEDPIGMSLLSDNFDPSISLPQMWGWTIEEDPTGRSPGFNYAKLPAVGISGDTSSQYLWRLRAPSVPGDYPLYARMQCGVDEFNENPLSRDHPDGLWFHVVPPPVVEDTSPRNGSVDVYVNTPIVLVFNKEMDRPSVEAAFNLTPFAPGSFTWEGEVARYNMDGFLEEGTAYTFTLDTSVRDMDGIHLQEPLEVNFVTGSGIDVYPPYVVSILASRAPLDAIVRITFSEPMDRASVEVAFSIDPPTAGGLSWQEDTLIFTPHELLDYDTLYTVHIDGSAQDLGGNAMGTSIYSTFLTIKDLVPPRVLGTDPVNGSVDVTLVTNVTLTFSPDVNTSSLAGALSWEPAVWSEISWEGATATLTPQHPLEEGTVYNLTVGTSLSDIRGNPMEEPYLLTFTTAGSSDRIPPYLEATTPPAGSNIIPGGSVRLVWSEPMDRDSVEEAIMVSPIAETSFSWSDRVLVVTLEGLDVGTVYTINIDSSIRDRAGNTALEPYALRYVATPDPAQDRPVFYVDNWIETWWDLALLVSAFAVVALAALVQVRYGWRRVVLTMFAWVEERTRTARYLGDARRLYYSIDRQMPHSHAERYGSKTVWYWYPFYCLGGIAILCFIILGITGLVLSLYYVPSAEGSPSQAYGSIESIMEDVTFGYMFRAIHHWAANIMIAAVFLHMLRVYFTGAYRNPRELNWVVGVSLLGLTIFYGFSGYLLPWNQLSYWAGTIGVEMCRAVPVAGDWFAELVFGGVTLGTATLTRMYFFHVLLLPIITVVLLVVHVVAVYIQGLAEPH